tara:strand:+ start:337 stop:594 length:258 start_codon:yes stop_codon:yes gene_type:complete
MINSNIDLTKDDLEVLGFMEYDKEKVKDEYDNDLWMFVLCKSQDLDEDWKEAVECGNETQERYNETFTNINNLLAKLDPMKMGAN